MFCIQIKKKKIVLCNTHIWLLLGSWKIQLQYNSIKQSILYKSRSCTGMIIPAVTLNPNIMQPSAIVFFFFFFFNEGTFLKQRAQVSFVLRNFRNYFYLVNELNSLVNIIQNDKTLYSERFISELTYCFGLRIYLPTFGAHYYFLFFFFLLTYKNKCQ